MAFIRSVYAVTASFALLAGVAWSVAPVPAQAAGVTAKECHAKFKAAKEGGTLAGQSYKDFKTAQCAGSEAETEDQTAPAATAAPAASTADEEKSATGKAPAKTASTYSGNAVFPSKVSTKYPSLIHI